MKKLNLRVVIGLSVLGWLTIFGIGYAIGNIGNDGQDKEVALETNIQGVHVERVEILRNKMEKIQVKFEDETDEIIKGRMEKLNMEFYNKYIIPMSDGSTIIACPQVDKYNLFPVELGDYDYQVDNEEEFKKLVTTYLDNKNYKDILQQEKEYDSNLK